MGPGLTELMAAPQAQGTAPAGPWFTHHLRRPSDTFDFEIAVPVDAAVTPVGRVKPSELRATRVARTLYQGPYEGLSAAWGEFQKWISGAGHVAAPDLWEVYAVGPESVSDPAQYRTELNQPLVG